MGPFSYIERYLIAVIGLKHPPLMTLGSYTSNDYSINYAAELLKSPNILPFSGNLI